MNKLSTAKRVQIVKALVEGKPAEHYPHGGLLDQYRDETAG